MLLSTLKIKCRDTVIHVDQLHNKTLSTHRPVISQDYLFYKSPYASKCSWKKKRSSYRGTKEVACIVSCLWGMWRVCKSSKIDRPGGSVGALSSRPNGRPRPTTRFSGIFFSLIKSHSRFFLWFRRGIFIHRNKGKHIHISRWPSKRVLSHSLSIKISCVFLKSRASSTTFNGLHVGNVNTFCVINNARYPF